jgi:hypothetical protein
MTLKIAFVGKCPGGHDVDNAYDREDLKANIDTPKANEYFCSVCGKYYKFSDEQRNELKQQLKG